MTNLRPSTVFGSSAPTKFSPSHTVPPLVVAQPQTGPNQFSKIRPRLPLAATCSSMVDSASQFHWPWAYKSAGMVVTPASPSTALLYQKTIGLQSTATPQILP